MSEDPNKPQNHLTQRSFVRLGVLAGGTALLAGLSACAGQEASPGSASHSVSAPTSQLAENSQSAPAAVSGTAQEVYFARAVNPEALQAVFNAIGAGLFGNVGAKLSTGEPDGNHYLKADLISGIVSAVGAAIVE